MPHFASCETKEYTVKFKEDYIVSREIKEFLNVVKEEKNLYITKYPDKLEGYKEYIEKIYENKEITLIEDIKDVTLFALPKDPGYSSQKHLELIKASKSWEYETYGNDIRVGVIDSGCFYHSDLKDNLLPGWNYVENSSDTTDTYGHGTHVSGIIAASMNEIGVVGVAPKAKIIPLKCFNSNSGSPIDIIKAIYDAVDEFDCHIINFSLGIKESLISGEFWEDDFKEAIDYAYEKGAILVGAAGNYKTSEICYPAGYDNVIGVGSVDFDKTKSNFSQYNSSVTVVAPGQNKGIYSTCIIEADNSATPEIEYEENYKKSGGTSQAAPQVAGMAAVALSINPDLTQEEFIKLLQETSEDLGEPGRDDYYGYGLINIEEMVKKLTEEKDFYISPVNTKNSIATVFIKNNSPEPQKVMSIFSEYKENQFSSLLKTPLELEGNEEIILTFQYSGNKINHFLWESDLKLNPKAIKRNTQTN